MNDGKELEQVVAILERSLGGTGARVEQCVRLPDKHTGELRQHDVVIVLSGLRDNNCFPQ